MPQLAVIGIALAVTFLAELPDKPIFASLILATRYRPLWVWAGAAAAFTAHMVIAVTAGQLLALLPHRIVEGIVAGLFAAGACYLWVGSFRPQHHAGAEAEAARMGAPRATFWRVAASCFAVIFLAEWGDITQIATANLAARYGPVPVFAGATLGLWAAAALAVNIGAKSLSVLPLAWVSRITGTILLALGIISALAAIRG